MTPNRTTDLPGRRLAECARALERASTLVQLCPPHAAVAVQAHVRNLTQLLDYLLADDVHGPDAA